MANLRQLHTATMLYIDDEHADRDYRALPPPWVVYSPHFVADDALFRSPCGAPPAAYSNARGFTTQYVFDYSAKTLAYFREAGDQAALFVDGSCNADGRLWSSRIARKRALGVRFNGSIIDVYKRGDARSLGFWGPSVRQTDAAKPQGGKQ